MSIVYPENRKEVADRMLTDVQNELPGLNPFLRESIVRAITIAIAGRIFDVYTQQQQGQLELFPDSATAAQLTFILRFGLFKGINVEPAKVAVGFITAKGSVSSVIPIGTKYINESEIEYSVINQDATIASVVMTLGSSGSLTLSGTTATLVFSTDHSFATSISITVAGADQTEYNGTFVTTVTGDDSCTYEITGSPATPATGDITVTATIAEVEVQSDEAGSDKNLDSGAKLTLQTPIGGVDDDAYVQFGGIAGGADQETNDEYQDKVIENYANPRANSNNATISDYAKMVPFVNRTWVFDATPTAGEFRTYFTVHTTEAEESVIPDAQQVAEVKTSILNVKPVPMRDEDVHVIAPTAVVVDFVFTALVPDSQALRAAIENSLMQMFLDVPNVSENLPEDAYRSAIYQTVNPETGEFVDSFALSTPTGAISIADGELAVWGTATWNV